VHNKEASPLLFDCNIHVLGYPGCVELVNCLESIEESVLGIATRPELPHIPANWRDIPGRILSVRQVVRGALAGRVDRYMDGLIS